MIGPRTGGGASLATTLRSVGLCATLLGIGVVGCSGPPPGPPLPPTPEWTTERSAAAERLAARLGDASDEAPLVVRLAFDEAVDLDLYVTGPQLETVYYANTPSRIGGALVADLRCARAGDTRTDAARIETITFPAVPGRYRVGVDYPHACGPARDPAPFALRVDLPGGPLTERGIAVYHVFEPIVLEFELATDPEAEAGTGNGVEPEVQR